MPSNVWIEFDIPLSVRGDTIRVRIVRNGKVVVDFVAQYEALIDGVYRPVLRYDGSHGRPHCDILGWRGETVEKVWLPEGTSHSAALTLAIDDIRERWMHYRAESIVSERDDAMTDEETAQTSANLALASRFIREYLDDPNRYGDPPEGAAVVLMPPDDPALAAANLAMAERLAAEGRRVMLARVGEQATDYRAWDGDERRLLEFRSIRPNWAADLDPADASVVYDADRDVLLVDLAGGRRHGRALPVNDAIAVLVDIEPQEAYGYVVPGFLAHAVRRAPRLAQILSLASLRSLSPEELGGLDVPASDVAAGSAAPTAAGDPNTIDAFVRDIELLSA